MDIWKPTKFFSARLAIKTKTTYWQLWALNFEKLTFYAVIYGARIFYVKFIHL